MSKKEKKDEIDETRISPRTGKPIQKKYAPKIDHTKPVKKKGKPRGGNSPVIGMNGYELEKGDNNKTSRLSIELFNLPNIDLDNPDDVAKRLSEYFEIYAKYDMRPTVSGIALVLNGMSRETLTAIARDQPTGGNGYKTALRPDVALLIKKAYKLLETMWENNFQSGKLNPVAGIFLAKNNYGYKDQSETILTPNKQDNTPYSADEIKSRYVLQDKQDDQND